MSWLKAEAPSNIPLMTVTSEVSHAPMSWLKAEALVNIPFIAVTPGGVPCADVLVEGGGAVEHQLIVVTFGRPRARCPVEAEARRTCSHVRDAGGVPRADVFVEGRRRRRAVRP